MSDGKITIQTEIDQSGAKKGTKTLQSNLDGASKKARKVGGNMSKYLTAPILALGGTSLLAADQVDQAYKNIQVATGETGDELEGLKESFDNVFTSVPDNADKVSEALGTINTLTGATGDVLEELTENVLDASRSLGEDGAANAEAFGKAMEQWQIPAEEGAGELDKLYKLTQDYGVGLGEISSHLSEYGSVLQNAGFNMSESADLMSKLEAGGLSVSRVMPGLNMAFRNWASEGKNSREEFEKTIQKMQDAESETDALAIATEEFGAEGAQRLTTAIRNGSVPALDELGQGMEDSKGTIQETTDETKTIGEQFQEFKNQATMALEPLGGILLELAEKAIPPLIAAVTKVAEWFKNLPGPAQMVIVVIGALIAVIGPLLVMLGLLVPAITAVSLPMLGIVAAVVAVIAIIATLTTLVIMYWDEIKSYTLVVWEMLKEFFKQAWIFIKETFMASVELIKNGVLAAWDWIKNTTKTVWNAIKDFIVGLWEGIKTAASTVFEGIKTAITTVWNTIKTVSSNVWNGIVSVLSGIWNGLKSSVGTVFDWISGTIEDVWEGIKTTTENIWDGITGAVKGAVNGVIDAINKMLGAIGNISIDIPKVPDWVPKFGGMGGGSIGFPDIPKIPSLDVGTNFVAQDGLAMLHQGEAVVPKEYNPAAGGDGGIYEFHIEIPMDGEAVARKTVKFTARELENMKVNNARGRGIRK